MNEHLDAIRDRDLTDGDLTRHLAALGDVVEPPAWWNDLAGDAGYRAHHRALAIVALFRRHLAPGATLAALAGASWLDRSSIATIDAVAGKLPVPYDPADTVVVAHVTGELAPEISAIYLRISGRWSRDEILADLGGKIVRAYAILDASGAIIESAR